MTQSHLPPQDLKPLSLLPMVSALSQGQLTDLRPLLAKLRAARSKPHAFDEEAIDRVIRVHTEALKFLPYTLRQLEHWEMRRPSAAEQQTIQRIRAEVGQIERMLQEILLLAREIGAGTINQVLDTDDFASSLTALAGVATGLETDVDTHTFAPHVDPEHLATQVDARMNALVAQGLDDATIFAKMRHDLPAILDLMDEEGMLDILRKRHAGLDRYVGLIEEAAGDLQAALRQSLR